MTLTEKQPYHILNKIHDECHKTSRQLVLDIFLSCDFGDDRLFKDPEPLLYERNGQIYLAFESYNSSSGWMTDENLKLYPLTKEGEKFVKKYIFSKRGEC